MKIPLIGATISQLPEARIRVAQSEISMSIIPQKVRKYQQLQELTSMHRETHRIRFAPPSRLPAPEKWLRFSQIPPTTSHQPPATNLASFLRISLRQPQADHPPTSRRHPLTHLAFRYTFHTA